MKATEGGGLVIFRKDGGALRRKGGQSVTVCLGLVSTSCLLCDKSPSSLVDETPWKGTEDHEVPVGLSVFKQRRGVQRKPLSDFAIFKCL